MHDDGVLWGNLSVLYFINDFWGPKRVLVPQNYKTIVMLELDLHV